MSHGRRPILQLDDSNTASSTYVSTAAVEDEDDGKSIQTFYVVVTLLVSVFA